MELMEHQKKFLDFSEKVKYCILGDEVGLGKAQPKTEPVLTPEGFKPIGEIKAGDSVIGANGNPTKVTGVYPQGVRDIFKVIFSDGTYTFCCDEHLWSTRSKLDRDHKRGYKVRQLSEMRGNLKYRNQKNYSIPLNEPITGKDLKLPIHPYILGYLLGNGGMSTSSIMVTTTDVEVIDRISRLLTNGYYIKPSGSITYRITKGVGNLDRDMHDYLRDSGLMGLRSYEKHIPKEYLESNINDRLELLRGMMDADGTMDYKGGKNAYYTTSSKRLSEDFCDLVRGLGGIAKVKTKIPYFMYKGEKKEGRLSYNINVTIPDVNLFSLARKREKYTPHTKYGFTKYLVGVEPAGSADSVCISVEAEDRLYITRDYIVTHNTISALAVAKKYSIKVLVICPAYLVENWKIEAKKWETTITVTSYKPKPYAVASDFDTIILDESQYIKNLSAKRTHYTVELIKNIKPDRLLLLSATSILKNAGDFWVPCILMDMDPTGSNGDKITSIYKTEYSFKNAFCEKSMLKIRGRFHTQFKGHKNLNTLKRLLTGKYVKRRADKVLDLPEFQIIPVRLQHTDVNGLDNEFNSPKKTEGVTSAKARSAELKVPYTVSFIEDLLQSDSGPIVVFSDHIKPVELIVSGLKHTKAVGVTGAVSTEDRQQIVQRFQRGEIDVLVATIGSLSTGHTLTKSRVMVFNDMSWTGAFNRQARGRIRRIGQKNACIYYEIYYGKVDEQIIKVVSEKEHLLDQF